MSFSTFLSLSLHCSSPSTSFSFSPSVLLPFVFSSSSSSLHTLTYCRERASKQNRRRKISLGQRYRRRHFAFFLTSLLNRTMKCVYGRKERGTEMAQRSFSYSASTHFTTSLLSSSFFMRSNETRRKRTEKETK